MRQCVCVRCDGDDARADVDVKARVVQPIEEEVVIARVHGDHYDEVSARRVSCFCVRYSETQSHASAQSSARVLPVIRGEKSARSHHRQRSAAGCTRAAARLEVRACA